MLVKLNGKYGGHAIVDRRWALAIPEILEKPWHQSNKGYVRRSIYVDGVVKSQFMHRLIYEKIHGEIPEGYELDHINRNTLDNRRCNLRLATCSQNHMNTVKHRKSSSKYKGVCWCKKLQKWGAYISINKKKQFLGYFEKEEDAARRYNTASRKYYKRFKQLNKVKG